MANNKPQEGMDDQMLQEWSRHYDNLLWTVITIFTVGVGALFGYSMTTPQQNPWPEITGVVLGLLGVFWVAGFRSFRSNLHGRIRNKELYAFLADPAGKGRGFLTQWNVFVFSFVVLSAVFMYKLYLKIANCRVLFWGGAVLVLAAFLYVWKMGKSESRPGGSEQPQAATQASTQPEAEPPLAPSEPTESSPGT